MNVTFDILAELARCQKQFVSLAEEEQERRRTRTAQRNSVDWRRKVIVLRGREEERRGEETRENWYFSHIDYVYGDCDTLAVKKIESYSDLISSPTSKDLIHIVEGLPSILNSFV